MSRFSRFATALIVSVITISGMYPAHAQDVADKTETLYIAPYGHCDDTSTGKSEDEALCSLSTASSRFEQSYQRGTARSDVEIRFVTDHGSFTPEPGDATKDRTFSFAPAPGSYARFLPDWYTTDQEALSRPSSDYPHFIGDVQEQELVTGTENYRGFNITPNRNRGGSYEIAYLHIDRFIDGIMLNGRVKYSDPDDTQVWSSSPANGVVRGAFAPVNNAIIRNNLFNNIGDEKTHAFLMNNGRKVRATSQGNAALRFWNTTNTLISDNQFNNTRNVKDRGKGHTIYGYVSSHALVTGNTFKNSTGTTVHGRMNHDWKVENNKFNKEKSYQVSSWYRGSKYGPDSGRYAECRYDFADYKDNGNTVNGSFSSLSVQNWDIRQTDYCTSDRRIFSPGSVSGQQKTHDSYTVSWTPAQPNVNPIDNYKVYLGTTDKNVIEVGSVPASSPLEFTITEDMMKELGVKQGKEAFYYVLSEDSHGHTSARTSNKTHFVMDKTIHGKGQAISYTNDYKMGQQQSSSPVGSSPSGSSTSGSFIAVILAFLAMFFALFSA